jgi:hypothetical protein
MKLPSFCWKVREKKPGVSDTENTYNDKKNTIILSDTLPIMQSKHSQNNQQPTMPHKTTVGPRTEPRNQKPASDEAQQTTKEGRTKRTKDNKCKTEEGTEQGCAGLECLVVSYTANYTNTRLKALR